MAAKKVIKSSLGSAVKKTGSKIVKSVKKAGKKISAKTQNFFYRDTIPGTARFGGLLRETKNRRLNKGRAIAAGAGALYVGSKVKGAYQKQQAKAKKK